MTVQFRHAKTGKRLDLQKSANQICQILGDLTGYDDASGRCIKAVLIKEIQDAEVHYCKFPGEILNARKVSA